MSTQSPEARPEQVDQPTTEHLQQHPEVHPEPVQAKEEISSDVKEPSTSPEQATSEPTAEAETTCEPAKETTASAEQEAIEAKAEPETEAEPVKETGQTKEETTKEASAPKESLAVEQDKTQTESVAKETNPSEYLAGGYLYCRSNGLIPHVIKRYFFIKDAPMPLENLNYYYKKHFQGSLNKQPEDDPSLSSEQANESSSSSSQSLYVDRIAKAVEGCKGLLFYSKSQCTSVPSGIISLLDVDKVEAGNGNKFLLYFESGKTETLEASNVETRDAWIKDLNAILSQKQEIKAKLEASSTYSESLNKLNKIANSSGTSPLEILRSIFPSFKGKSTTKDEVPSSEAADKGEPTSPKDNVIEFLHHLLKGKDHEKIQEENPEEAATEEATNAAAPEDSTEAPAETVNQHDEAAEGANTEAHDNVEDSPSKKRGFGLLAYSKSWKTPKVPKSTKPDEAVPTDKGNKADQSFEHTKAKLEYLPTSISRKLTEFVHKKKQDKPTDVEEASPTADKAAEKPEEPPTPTSTPVVKTANDNTSTTKDVNELTLPEQSTPNIVATEPNHEPTVPEVAA
ncbi:meiotic chromosome segregation protein Meu6 [Schizosaccharomyces octosporus yFS286]|uniref:Meiotic chromosome segregation protein Meu6 n=1 Tax=Schizosaccharomyces octosporus (strain yFS286) TaxID=483514 RepID=S9R537_SCHOY|nr:meiotic chromosome segregation protein Meu6 [Schizosaccharomyces octosporus yFS286]EPX73460.1 meiotic chromosome segregation protein Meu6 [Schizosaccharomyces octosporus yFS286]